MYETSEDPYSRQMKPGDQSTIPPVPVAAPSRTDCFTADCPPAQVALRLLE